MLVHICSTCNWLPGSDWQRVLGRRRSAPSIQNEGRPLRRRVWPSRNGRPDGGSQCAPSVPADGAAGLGPRWPVERVEATGKTWCRRPLRRSGRLWSRRRRRRVDALELAGAERSRQPSPTCRRTPPAVLDLITHMLRSARSNDADAVGTVLVQSRLAFLPFARSAHPEGARGQGHAITHNLSYPSQVYDLMKETSDELGCGGVCDGGPG